MCRSTIGTSRASSPMKSTCQLSLGSALASKGDSMILTRQSDTCEKPLSMHTCAQSTSSCNLTCLASSPSLRCSSFLALFDKGVAKHRRPMLALVGGTNLGKSFLAAHVLELLAQSLGVNGFLEVTVEGSPHLDLTGFDHRVHSGVLLDGAGDAFFLRTHREVLQGRKPGSNRLPRF